MEITRLASFDIIKSPSRWIFFLVKNVIRPLSFSYPYSDYAYSRFQAPWELRRAPKFKTARETATKITHIISNN